MIRPAALVAALAAAPLTLPLPAAAQQQAQDQQAEATPAQDASRPLPLSQEIRDTSTQALQETLYDLYALQLAAHQEHWNVVGEEFYQLHEFYEELYTSLDPFIDDVGARLRSLGAPADARPAEIGERTSVQPREPAPGDLEATVSALLDGFASVQSSLYDRIEATSEDLPTQDLLINIAFDIDMRTWMLAAHLE